MMMLLTFHVIEAIKSATANSRIHLNIIEDFYRRKKNSSSETTEKSETKSFRYEAKKEWKAKSEKKRLLSCAEPHAEANNDQPKHTLWLLVLS
jgi:hypothetical protein